jgi:hypothetical protein
VSVSIASRGDIATHCISLEFSLEKEKQVQPHRHLIWFDLIRKNKKMTQWSLNNGVPTGWMGDLLITIFPPFTDTILRYEWRNPKSVLSELEYLRLLCYALWRDLLGDDVIGPHIFPWEAAPIAHVGGVKQSHLDNCMWRIAPKS